MATKSARAGSAGTTKNRARKERKNKTIGITRATSPKDKYLRLLETCQPESDAAYLNDEAVLGEIMDEFSFDEFMAIDPYTRRSLTISCGSPQFRTEILPFLSQALRNRRQRLRNLLKDIRSFFQSRLADYYPDLSEVERDRAVSHVVTSAQENYEGEIENEAVMVWTADKMKQTVIFIRAIRAYEKGASQVFADLYKHRQALLGGIKEILADCRDLGVDGDTYSEIEQTAWAYIWERILDWNDPSRDRAAVTTRLFGLGKKTAIIWRTARLRSRDRAEWIAYLLNHYGLSEKHAPDEDEELRQAA